MMQMSFTGLPGTVYLVALCVTIGCAAVPSKYVREAVPNFTFSTLAAKPELYHDRLVILGAVITKEEIRRGDLWLHVKNRPLDKDYRPQLPSSPHGPEAGSFWIVVANTQTIPDSYHHWADMTVVGRVTGIGPGNEPLLKMVYIRGWGVNSAHDGVWEHIVDLNYASPMPSAIRGELGQQ